MEQCLTDCEIRDYFAAEGGESESIAAIELHLSQCEQCRRRLDEEKLYQDLKLAVRHGTSGSTKLSAASTDGRSERPKNEEFIPPEVPGYLVGERIKGGGQGVVFRATQLSTKREVAIKFLRQKGLAQTANIVRFRREIETVANFVHPNIVTLFESGVADGSAYYSMELLSGSTLDQFFLQHPAGKFHRGRTSDAFVKMVVKTFITILNAIAYAHRKGVVHRDLKPANIMVTGDGTPRVLDFGLAQISDLIREDTEDRDLATSGMGEFFGTPAYSSPEQVSIHGETVDTRSDIYSLGIVLFEILTRRFPYSVNGSFDVVLSEIKKSRPADPRILNRAIDDDLQAIMLKAIAKNPDERYSSAEQLAEDLRAFLECRPIAAKKEHRWYVTRKLVARNKLVTASISLTFLFLIVALFVSTRFYRQAVDDRDDAVKSKITANEALEEVAEQKEQTEYERAVANLAAAAGAIQLDDVVDATKRLLQIPERLRGWEWYHFLHFLDESERVVAQHDRYAEFVRFGREEDQVISAGQDRRILVSSLSGNTPQRFLIRDSNGPVAVSDDGEHIAYGAEAGIVKVVRVADFKEVCTIQTRSNLITALRFLPDNQSIACGVATVNETNSERIGIEVWRLKPVSLAQKFNVVQWHVNAISVAPDQKKIGAVTFAGGTVWSVETGNELVKLPDRPGNETVIAFDPTGERIATGGEDGIIYCQSVSNAQTGKSFRGHRGEITAVQFAGNDQLYSVSRDKTVKCWDFSTGQLVRTFKGHTWGVTDIDFDRQGMRFATSSWDNTIRLWETAKEDSKPLRSHSSQIFNLAVSSRGSRYATASFDGTVKVWKTVNQKLKQTLKLGQPAHCVCFSHDEKILATSGWNQPVKLWNTRNWKQIVSLSGHEKNARVHSIAFSKDDRWLVSGGSDNRLIVWDVKNQKLIKVLNGHDDHIHTVAFSSDNQFIASAGHRSIRIWNTKDFSLERKFERRMLQDDYSLAFHPSKNWLAAGADVGLIKLWDVETGNVIASFQGHNDEIKSVDFYPDGSRMVSCSFDNRIVVWDTERRNELLTMFGYSGPPNVVAFDSTGFFLLCGFGDGDVKIWKGIGADEWKQKMIESQ